MSIEKILIIDDEELLRSFLAQTLRLADFDVETAENGKKGIALFKEKFFDMVLTDMKMPDISGMDVLKAIKELSPSTLVVVITAYGSIENAVEAMRLGAFNYLIKPFSPDSIEAVVEKAKEYQNLLAENQYLREEATGQGGSQPQRVIAASPLMKHVLEDAARVAKSNANVFITGESGTGKEIIAQQIHSQSPRAQQPFIKVNCAAIPETLVESEFFGHEKGAFTGANTKKPGRFELANKGTLLLDEVTEIPLAIQAKLLRVAQERVFERVGGTKSIKVDVRLIATSNRDIRQAIDNKTFREDLYYRLNVLPLYLPPLKERPEDILPLVNYFLEKMCGENHKEKMTLSSEAAEILLNYRWPGNVRELANIIERAVVMTNAKTIHPEQIYLDSKAAAVPAKPTETGLSSGLSLPIGMSLQELEKRLIIETLHAQNHNRSKTAKILGISPRTLRNKLDEYGHR
ncbi:MAG: sigma-54 dependent transcriptional regulator [Waddliaceae bacterium]